MRGRKLLVLLARLAVVVADGERMSKVSSGRPLRKSQGMALVGRAPLVPE
jgi:hypothetical protein